MRGDSSTPDTPAATAARAAPVTISRWVNERYPPLNELLSSHDVARLTRRPRWVVTGLSLIGRFPTKLKFRGRAIGWSRSEILDWMSRDLAVACNGPSSPRSCSRKHPRQACLPLECAVPCMATRKCASRLPAAPCKNRSGANILRRVSRGETKVPASVLAINDSEHAQ